jgi:hypothetical protein
LKYPDIITIITGRRLEWLGHVVSMGGERAVKSYWNDNQEVEEKKERTRLRWSDDNAEWA